MANYPDDNDKLKDFVQKVIEIDDLEDEGNEDFSFINELINQEHKNEDIESEQNVYILDDGWGEEDEVLEEIKELSENHEKSEVNLSEGSFKDQISNIINKIKSLNFNVKRLKSKKPQSKGQNVIFIEEKSPADSFIILEEKKSYKHVISAIKYSLLIVLFFISLCSTYFLLSYQAIPEDVMGSDYKFRGLSIVSRDYTPPLGEIKEGDIIIKSSVPRWFPIVAKYETYIFRSKSGGIIFVESMDGSIKKIEYTDIDFITRNER